MFSTIAFAQQAQREPRLTPKQAHAGTVQETSKPRQADIDRNAVLIIVKSALLALDQANKT